MRLVSVDQMRRLENEAVQTGLSYKRMMLNAGNGLAEFVNERFRLEDENHALGLVGPGNNGGDTLVALTNLEKNGWSTTAYVSNPRDIEDPLVKEYLLTGGEFINHSEEKSTSKFLRRISMSQVILDGLLGTGIELPLRGCVLEVLQTLESVTNLPDVVAVDCPSGVNADTGKADPSVLPANCTVCMAAVKQGILQFPAFALAGEIYTIDIGLPDTLPTWYEINGTVTDAHEVARMLPERHLSSHKGTYGTCMIIAGSVNYCGAVLLAAEGAYRVGAGLLKAAIPSDIFAAIAGELPEVTWISLPSTEGGINPDAADVIYKRLEKISALLIGPGLGLGGETGKFFEQFISRIDLSNRDFPPIVFDADALKLLARIDDWYRKIPAGSILTPHPGEMAVLTDLSTQQIQAERIQMAVEYSRKWGHIIVLKGAGTVIAKADGTYTIIPIATSALAKAGTGDVLAGMITGLLGQGMDSFDAAVTGTWIHASAGKRAAGRIGADTSVLASDVIQSIPGVIMNLSGTR